MRGDRVNEAAGAAYRFVCNLFCDWYLELLKPVFMSTDETAKAESRACVAFVLEEIYKLLHPMMPFMTEELWAQNWRDKVPVSSSRWHGSAGRPEDDFKLRLGTRR